MSDFGFARIVAAEGGAGKTVARTGPIRYLKQSENPALFLG